VRWESGAETPREEGRLALMSWYVLTFIFNVTREWNLYGLNRLQYSHPEEGRLQSHYSTFSRCFSSQSEITITELLVKTCSALHQDVTRTFFSIPFLFVLHHHTMLNHTRVITATFAIAVARSSYVQCLAQMCTKRHMPTSGDGFISGGVVSIRTLESCPGCDESFE